MQDPTKQLVKFYENLLMQRKAIIQLKPKGDVRREGLNLIRKKQKELFYFVVRDLKPSSLFRYLSLSVMK